MDTPRNETETTIPLAEERLTIGKRQIETGRVRVRVVTDTDTVDAAATLTERNVEVRRVPIGREVTEVPVTRQENGVTIIPVFEEILVVEKRLVLIEELHISQAVTETEVSHPVELRRQRAEIERFAPDHTETARE